MKNTPTEIYLNFEERGEDFKDHSQITWSKERINDSDIRFVLSDNSVINSVMVSEKTCFQNNKCETQCKMCKNVDRNHGLH